MNGTYNSHAGRMAGLLDRLRKLADGRRGFGARAAEGEDLWDPRGMPDPITIALGGSGGRVARGAWFQRGAGRRIGR